MAYSNRGLARYESGDYEGAIADFNKAIELNPEFALTYNKRGIVKCELEDYEGAISDFNQAIELDK